MGGQTALNIAMSMFEKGMLEGVKFLGAKPEAIKRVRIGKLLRGNAKNWNGFAKITLCLHA